MDGGVVIPWMGQIGRDCFVASRLAMTHGRESLQQDAPEVGQAVSLS
jgi:hypothetical protein